MMTARIIAPIMSALANENDFFTTVFPVSDDKNCVAMGIKFAAATPAAAIVCLFAFIFA